jgi:short/branched chain acyl-CoA dehydrogenase
MYRNILRVPSSFRFGQVRKFAICLNESERALRESVSTFARSTILPKVAHMDKEAKMDPDFVTSLFEQVCHILPPMEFYQGYMGVEVPERFGGPELSFTDSIIIIEEIAKVDPAVAALVDIHNTLVNRSIMKFGTEEQREKYLPLLSSNMVGSFAISESSGGSDAFGGMRTIAKRVSGSFVLNGEKAWISNSRDGERGLLLIFAMADELRERGYKGITAFLIDRDTPGVEVGKKEDKLGIRASSTCVISLNDVVVPEENVLGNVGDGYKIAIGLLNEGRIGIAGQMLGLAKGAFEVAMRYMMERKQFGQPIAEFQGLKHQYAQIYTEIEAAHHLVYSAAALKEQSDKGIITEKDFIKEASMAKLYASQIAEKTASKAIEWMGGVGFTKEYPAEKFFRDSKIGSIYEGTSNIQLDTIAKQLVKDFKP